MRTNMENRWIMDLAHERMYEKVPGDTSYGLTLYEQMIGKIN